MLFTLEQITQILFVLPPQVTLKSNLSSAYFKVISALHRQNAAFNLDILPSPFKFTFFTNLVHLQ